MALALSRPAGCGAGARLVESLKASEQLLESRVQERTAELQLLNARLEAISITDDLTGVANRRRFDAMLANEWTRAALDMARRVCDALRTLRLAHTMSAFGYVTVSIGVAAVFPADGNTPDELLRAADRALYAAKEQGRHQVILANGI
ncbi:MAG: diguanylate cyclase [Rhodoferax sp.]|nr:diguanylate cyclase [Rhodoferax sp.]